MSEPVWLSVAHPTLKRSVTTQNGALWEHTTLQPSRLLPPYLIAQLLELADELAQAPHPSLTPVSVLSREQTPTLLLCSPAHERLSDVARLAAQQGWPELPPQLIGAVTLELAKGLAHLHAHGFTHGAVRAEHVKLSAQGHVLFEGWLEGAIAQLGPEGARYGRGPEADWRALVRLFERALGEPQRLLADPSNLSEPAPLTHLPHALSAWLAEAKERPPQGLAFISSLEAALSASVGQLFPQGARGRWLKRLAPERDELWERALSDQPQLISQLVEGASAPVSPSLTSHAPSQASSLPSPSAQPLSAQLPLPPSPHPLSAQLAPQTTSHPQSAPPSAPPSAPSSDVPASASQQQNVSAPRGSWLERLEVKLNHLEARLAERLTPERPPQLKARVALLWNDTISSEGYYDPAHPITLGADEATISAPQLTQDELWSLMVPTSRGVVISAPEGATGWFEETQGATRDKWVIGQPTPIAPSGRGLLRFGALAVYFELLYITPNRVRFKLPIPNISPLTFASTSFAALLHLSLLVSAYGLKRYEQRAPGTMPVSRFVEVIVEEQPDKEIEEPPEEEEEEQELVDEPSSEPQDDAPTLPPPDTTPPPREEARRLSQERFGKGEAAVQALASFLSGSTKTEGALSLGDASAALGSGTGALALGSAFGEAGGDISLGGGGGGGLDTSVGLGGAGRAGQLKAKRPRRKVRGRVKTLKSTMRALGSNGLSKEAVLAAIRKQQVKIAACYERQLLKQPNISGMLTLSWEITPSGSVSSAREATSSLGSPALSACVMQVIKRTKFPSSKGKTKVKYPFVFQQG